MIEYKLLKEQHQHTKLTLKMNSDTLTFSYLMGSKIGHQFECAKKIGYQM